MPVETMPVETKPVETKPAETEPPEVDNTPEVWLLIKQETYQPRGVYKGNLIYEYTYDSNGFLVKEEDSWARGELIERYIYTNDSFGNVIKTEYDDYSSGQSGTTVFVAKYDSYGRIVEKYAEGSSYIWKYKYDDDGILSEAAREYYNKQGILSSGIKTLYKNGKEHQKYTYYSTSGWLLLEEWFYDSKGFLTSSKQYWHTSDNRYYDEGAYEGVSGPLTFHTVTFQATYQCDVYGNVINATVSTPYGNETYKNTYMTLSEYRQKGLCDDGGGDPNAGTAKCAFCKQEGYSRCQGHDCTVCSGVGSFVCKGCYGTGKKYGETCPVCYGMTTQTCPNCKGGKKIFYD